MGNTVRCAGCGQVLEDGAKTIRVSIGKNTGSNFTESREWGRLHEACFESSIESPDVALARVRKLAKRAVVTAAKKAKNG